jgi:hypothetical protein
MHIVYCTVANQIRMASVPGSQFTLSCLAHCEMVGPFIQCHPLLNGMHDLGRLSCLNASTVSK